MKKVIFSALTFCFLGSATVFAQSVGQDQDNPNTTQETINQDRPEADLSQSMKTEVEIQELPDAVLNSLAGEEFQEWTPTASYIVRDENETEHYAIELQNEEESKTVMFDAQGNKVESEDENVEDSEETEAIEETNDLN